MVGAGTGLLVAIPDRVQVLGRNRLGFEFRQVFFGLSPLAATELVSGRSAGKVRNNI
jgi:hypothetical protein